MNTEATTIANTAIDLAPVIARRMYADGWMPQEVIDGIASGVIDIDDMLIQIAAMIVEVV